jgi:hypothetical protein
MDIHLLLLAAVEVSKKNLVSGGRNACATGSLRGSLVSYHFAQP